MKGDKSRSNPDASSSTDVVPCKSTSKNVKRKLQSQDNQRAKKIKDDTAKEMVDHASETQQEQVSGEGFIKQINAKRLGVCEAVSKFKFNKKRVRVLTKEEDFADDTNGVLYWMSRDQRVQGEWNYILYSSFIFICPSSQVREKNRRKSN